MIFPLHTLHTDKNGYYVELHYVDMGGYMPVLTDLTYAANAIERAAGFMKALANANWKRARKRGAPGLVGEFARTVTGGNAWNFLIAANDGHAEGGWNGGKIVDFLAHYKVRTWNHGVTTQFIHFTVKRRQANWAEYLMLRMGIPVAGRLFNPAHAQMARRRVPGKATPAWADRKR